jgi:hypothetical protein
MPDVFDPEGPKLLLDRLDEEGKLLPSALMGERIFFICCMDSWQLVRFTGGNMSTNSFV